MKRMIVSLCTAGILLSSCNVPAADQTDSEMATAAAMTVQAAIDNATPLASPVLGQSNAEVTATYSQPFASVEDVTNCRTGPGVNYERVTQILPTDSVKMIGFFPPNYWIVSTNAGECWIAGEFVTPSGSYAAVPTVTAPPTPEAKAPEGVSLQKWEIFCNYETNEANVTIIWSDKDDETGYRILRNGELAAELSANSTQFGEVITLLAGQSVGYNVIAFNAAGSAASKTITLSC